MTIRDKLPRIFSSTTTTTTTESVRIKFWNILHGVEEEDEIRTRGKMRDKL